VIYIKKYQDLKDLIHQDLNGIFRATFALRVKRLERSGIAGTLNETCRLDCPPSMASRKKLDTGGS